MPPTVRDPGHSSNDHEMDSLGATHLFTTVTRVAYLMSERSERKNLVATVIARGGAQRAKKMSDAGIIRFVTRVRFHSSHPTSETSQSAVTGNRCPPPRSGMLKQSSGPGIPLLSTHHRRASLGVVGIRTRSL